MKTIDFNHSSFKGFQDGEDILIDTGILLAFFNEYDAYYSTVSSLFKNHIFNNDQVTFLYINPTIVNEITHLAQTPFKQYLKAHPHEVGKISQLEVEALTKSINNNVSDLINQGILNVLDGDSESVKHQIKLSKALGSADAVNASIANLYGTSFLTVDAALARNMKSNESELPNVRNVYFTSGRHRKFPTPSR